MSSCIIISIRFDRFKKNKSNGFEVVYLRSKIVLILKAKNTDKKFY